MTASMLEIMKKDSYPSLQTVTEQGASITYETESINASMLDPIKNPLTAAPNIQLID